MKPTIVDAVTADILSGEILYIEEFLSDTGTFCLWVFWLVFFLVFGLQDAEEREARHVRQLVGFGGFVPVRSHR